MGDRRFRQDAVAEIENERSLRQGLDDRVDRAVERRAAGEKRQRIEIALYRPAGLNLIACEAKLHRPIEPDRIDRYRFEIARKLGPGAAGKADDARAGNLLSDRGNNAGRRLDAPFAELAGRQNSRPGIENLHGIDAGLELPNK